MVITISFMVSKFVAKISSVSGLKREQKSLNLLNSKFNVTFSLYFL